MPSRPRPPPAASAPRETTKPANTFIATAEAVSNIGAIPVFADINAEHYTIDPAKIEERITPRTKAIIPVHLYGLPAEMDEIADIISNIISNINNPSAIADMNGRVKALCNRHPIY